MPRRPKPLSILESVIMIASAAIVIAIVLGMWRIVPIFTAPQPIVESSPL